MRLRIAARSHASPPPRIRRLPPTRRRDRDRPGHSIRRRSEEAQSGRTAQHPDITLPAPPLDPSLVNPATTARTNPAPTRASPSMDGSCVPLTTYRSTAVITAPPTRTAVTSRAGALASAAYHVPTYPASTRPVTSTQPIWVNPRAPIAPKPPPIQPPHHKQRCPAGHTRHSNSAGTQG